MSNDSLITLANAFHAASEQMREPPPRHPMLERLPEDPDQVMARNISADVLKAIGDVYMGQAVQDA